ncbi:MAG: Alpha subunit of the F1 sector of mitochondrial F1F0 ATP synthase [Claussenomyces sp. TS43310]|nr:MAG: Alpha subunit of the F1 sector of mitochondrial F1F0 ATP synthase [Claussenomyces sp. TS43310]
MAELVDGYRRAAITADAPDWYVCPIYKTLLGEAEAFDEACATTPLSFAPSLLDILTSSSPPSLDFFRGLSYLGCRGHGLGSVPPLGEAWLPGKNLCCGPGPTKRMVSAQDSEIMIRVLICLALWSEPSSRAIRIPTVVCFAGLPRLLATPLAPLAGSLCVLFFAGFETKLDALWTAFMPWKREDVGWLPLCSHTSLTERPRGITTMTEAQWEAYVAERRQQVKAQMAIVSKRREERERENNLEAYLARKRTEKLAWDHRNKDRVHQTAARVRARAGESGKHACQTCGISLASITALAKHKASKAHKEQERLAAGDSAKAIYAATERSRRFAAEKKASKAYYCAICDKAFNIKGHLTKHYTTKKHLEKVAASS